jgi:hypothetical protein
MLLHSLQNFFNNSTEDDKQCWQLAAAVFAK